MLIFYIKLKYTIEKIFNAYIAMKDTYDNLKCNFVIKRPKNLIELKERLDYLLGKNLAQLCDILQIKCPTDPIKAKGFSGIVFEKLLGADGNNNASFDFENLCLELKTIPVDEQYIPKESTFVTYAPVVANQIFEFKKSIVFKKLSFVLFILLDISDPKFSKRKFVNYYFFKPDKNTLELIEQDYNELCQMIKEGNINKITARFGQILQLRPKGANGSILTTCIDEDGNISYTRPRGFYLRREFTKKILANLAKGHS